MSLAEVYVDEYDKRDALKYLKFRVSKGEDVYEILGISPTEKYYVDKIVAGLVPMSLVVYNRIMKIDD